MHWINQCQGRARLTKDRDVGYAYSQEKRGHVSEEYNYSKKIVFFITNTKGEFSEGFTILKIAFQSLLISKKKNNKKRRTK